MPRGITGGELLRVKDLSPQVMHKVTTRITKQPGANGCWEWQGAASRGRPIVTDQGRTRNARRVAWVTANRRPLRPGKIVTSTCGNTLCLRPDHLILADSASEVQKIAVKHRKNKNLVPAITVRALRKDRLSTHLDLARRFNLSPDTVRSIRTNRTYHDPSYTPPNFKNLPKRLDDKTVAEIRRQAGKGMTVAYLAAKYNADYKVVWALVKGRYRNNIAA